MFVKNAKKSIFLNHVYTKCRPLFFHDSLHRYRLLIVPTNRCRCPSSVLRCALYGKYGISAIRGEAHVAPCRPPPSSRPRNPRRDGPNRWKSNLILFFFFSLSSLLSLTSGISYSYLYRLPLSLTLTVSSSTSHALEYLP